ncbi:hypothetical protein LUZ60_004756 [Juncus effusus]|nr:hypothetical protein LUZ60_004756 [Juncus effusus]
MAAMAKNKSKSKPQSEDAALSIMETLTDFTSKENWDNFFSLRGSGDSFEWYADWPELKQPLLSQLGGASDGIFQILVPGCGSSRLSEFVYDSGFKHVTNVDFSKVVVSDMLRRYVRSRPEMKWRIMDMTELQFPDETFDAVLDKGGLDALMEPEIGTKLGTKYLNEVKRVLKTGGKFICLTLAESHVLSLLLPEFRFGFETIIQAIPNKPSNKSNFETFMVIMKKEKSFVPNPIKSLFDNSSQNSNTKQANSVINAIEKENSIRAQHSLKDESGAKLEFEKIIPGRRFEFILGEEGKSIYLYKAILLDSKIQSEPFVYQCGIFIVPKIRANEWLFTSEEGQWVILESSKAARLIMVFLDSRHMHASMDIIQKDLSPLVRNLAPGNSEDGTQIPFMMASDGVKERNIVQQVDSKITGPIIVEDVTYENENEENLQKSPENKTYRRLVFERSLGLIQSEALLVRENNDEKKNNGSVSNSKKKKGQRKNDAHKDSKNKLKIDHTCLASSYHSGIISGFSLIASSLETASQNEQKVKAVIIGLGAGLLPMFLHGSFPFLQIEVAELDPVVVDLAKKHFGFLEDQQMKVHVGDGIKYLRDITASGTHNKETRILIIDADSSDLSSGLTCPHPDFLEESFLLSAKDFISDGGIFVINLVSRSSAIRETVISRLKAIFDYLFSLHLEEDVNEVLFASATETKIEAENFVKLEKLMKFPLENLQTDINKIQRLK